MRQESLDPVPVDAQSPVALGDPLRWRTRVVIGAAALALVISPVAYFRWSNDRWRTINISEVQVDGVAVAAGFHCDPEARLNIKESETRVLLTLQVRGRHKGDCAATATGTLRRTLGLRTVIDTKGGDRPMVRQGPRQ